MRKLFLPLVALTVATMSYAQSSVLATLSHEGTIKTYYGTSALKNAYNAAHNGDVITLSSGSFEAVNIAKGLTIRGAGMSIDTLSNSEPTVIMGDFQIKIPNTVTSRLILEGIYHNSTITYSGNLKNATFMKSRFKSIAYTTGGSLTNASFIHCKISQIFQLGENSNASCINSVIVEPSCIGITTSNFDCTNCVLYKDYWNGFYSSTLKNCILITDGERPIPSPSIAYNCLCLSNTGCNGGIFCYIPNNTNWIRNIDWENQFFESGNCWYADEETYVLSEEKQSYYIGTDGTQIGIHGGNLPFDPIPTNPRITKCNVAAKSTADGKLSVDIEVNGAE